MGERLSSINPHQDAMNPVFNALTKGRRARFRPLQSFVSSDSGGSIDKTNLIVSPAETSHNLPQLNERDI